MTSLIIDLIIVAIIVLCVWRGFSKGIILSVAGLLALVVAFYGAQFVADKYSDKFIDAMEPIVGSMVDEATTQEYVEARTRDEDESSQVFNVAVSVLNKMGLSQAAAETKAEQATSGITELGEDLRVAIRQSFMETIAYVFTFIIAFLLINIIFSVVLNLANVVFKLPGLRLLNWVGGSVAGLIYGLLIIFAIAWVLRFLGFVLPAETVERTVLLEWFMSHNPMFSLMGF